MKEYKRDCFAYRELNGRGKCAALSKMECENCKFYKEKGTECDSCKHKKKPTCTKCR